jgi:hypothetical protein
MDRRMRGLTLEHLQCDEIWTFCRKKQAHLTSDEQADDTIGDQFVFIALDERTKLIPSFVLGKRTRENTEAFRLDSRRGWIRTPSAPATSKGTT